MRLFRSHLRSIPSIGEPIRAELFSLERLEEHAQSLATAQRVTPSPRRGRRLLPQVEENARVLLRSYRAIAGAIREDLAITPAAEWLVDNFHLVEDQLHSIRQDLPPRFYRELPKLGDGPLAGFPRVYGIAWAYVAHTDSRFDPDALRRFVRAYQRVQPLTIGELWAVAITLRVVLIENLRRLAERMARDREHRQEADALADQLLALPPKEAQLLQPAAHAIRSPLPRAFAVRLVQRLSDQDPTTTPALAWLAERLADAGTTSEEIVRTELANQAATHVTVRNIMTSMRLISAYDWAEFFESTSLVDEALSAGTDFAAMDFATRDASRHAIEDLARGSRLPELEVARQVVGRAQRARLGGETAAAFDERMAEPGYYLIGAGRRAFEASLGFRAGARRRLTQAYLNAAAPAYAGAIAVVTALFLAVPLLWGFGDHEPAEIPWVARVLLGLLALFPALDLAIPLVNRATLALVGPRRLPRFSLRAGLPGELRTMIVVPMLLTSEAEVAEQIERLEVHYLANPEEEVRLALLSDWSDAPRETMPEDAALLAAAAAGIVRLNARHGPARDGGSRFLLFHRRRVWSQGEGLWIGWERKRGKLHELNRLLRGATDTTFIPPDGREVKAPAGVRYVITLDADTRLPRGVVRRLVGAIAHPLNRPRFDPVAGRVVEGYAILQPRVTPLLPTGQEQSLFQRVFSSPAGIDPYAAAVSDLYQDLFGEGSFTGKGVYDVDAFEAALAGRAPENVLLSHDLFESAFARAGLVTDTEVMEPFPSRYEVAAMRQHRWVRGDWQLLRWIFGRPARGIPALARWKMADNLRRSFSPPAAVAALLAAWILPGAAAGVWTAFVLATIAVPAFLPVLSLRFRRRDGTPARTRLRGFGGRLALAAVHVWIGVTLLAHQAWLLGDAIVRTLYRLYVTRRNLLQWVTAAQAESGSGLGVGGYYRWMAGGVILAVVAGAVALLGRAELWTAAPLVILWVTSPLVASWIGRTPHPPSRALSAKDAQILRLAARRTWRYFESFVTAEHHMLPPDNVQEEPGITVASRTSPTNIGLYLLSVIAARDFGWIGTVEAVERLEETMEALTHLERHRGHLFNWYDTHTLRPLEPRYISTVDSGNLAGHLIVVANACAELAVTPVTARQALSGILDALHLARAAAAALPDDRRTQTVTRKHLAEALDVLAAALAQISTADGAWRSRLAASGEAADALVDIARTLRDERGDAPADEVRTWAEATRAAIHSHSHDLESTAPADPTSGGDTNPAADPYPAAAPAEAHSEMSRGPDALSERVRAVARFARSLIAALEFDFLFDPVRKLFAIGYRPLEGALESGYYDLLASEARLASFVAIAKGDVPAEHWFHLDRPMTPVDSGATLVSWSGSMFEYLMPALVMDAPAGSLLEAAGRFAVRRHIEYGNARGVPWGASESAFSGRDLSLTYQYSTFGVPGLGLKRGLGDELVIAPYATALAAMVDPAAAARNFVRLVEAEGSGPYGFYEALDYTRARLPEGKRMAVVRAYMTHHQGMTLVALGNVIHQGAMRTRFHAEPMVRATELLLQERVPREAPLARPRAEEIKAAVRVEESIPPVLRRFASPHDPTPRTHLLSNGHYTVMMTAAGSGFSRWDDLAITRWREDATRDCWGTYIFLRDTRSGHVWSAGFQPSGATPDIYEARFAEDHVEILRQDGSIATALEVVVSPEENGEVRRVSLTNLGTRLRDIEVTSYAEVVLAPYAADAAHPAFSNLFVQTEFVPEVATLLATRRPQVPDEARVWLAHTAVVEGEVGGGVQYETDRARFVGRGRGIRTPMSVIDGRPLSNTAGTVLDPIISLRHRVRIPARATVRVTFTTLVAASREEALVLSDRHRDPAAFERAAMLAWTQAQVQLHHLHITADEAHLYQRLANRLLYLDPTMRPAPDTLARALGGPRRLWPHGISGDLPIVLLRIDDPEDRAIVREALRAHAYWRQKRLAADLVIINEQPHSYAQDLHGAIETLIRTTLPTGLQPRSPQGSVFILRGEALSRDDREALEAAARAVILSRHGSLADQVVRPRRPATPPARRRPRRARPAPETPPSRPHLMHFNGLGGFTEDGREYVTILGEGQWTPAPWINVVANPHFGFQVSESGAGSVWSANSRLNQLTQWSNDPVSDPPGEIFYVRDEDTGELWGPTVLPIREEPWPYVARHGQGYSRFEHTSHGIHLDLLQFVPLADPIKISRLVVENHSDRARRLSVTAYIEWVLGIARSTSAPFIVTEVDAATHAMFARNIWRDDFGGRIAFADLGGRQTSWTGDRTEFLGRNGTPDHPAVLEQALPLSGRVGAGMDPCSALQTLVELPPGGRREILLLLGETPGREEARQLIERYRAVDLDGVFRAVTTFWDETVGAIQVRTPDRSMDLLLNRWLLYQTLACRLWARTAFYQAGGAYGFRDQLQDVIALLVTRRELAREHLLRAAARQFVEGDVQHWWHPHSGTGVRTRSSDDRLWLPYAVLHYVQVTRDAAILDELIPFLEGPALAPKDRQAYFAPAVSSQQGTLFEHCARALDISLATGEHGLPLIGTGDWNDAMNRVGHQGQGESVWLGWMLHTVLWEFAALAEARGEQRRAESWRRHVHALKGALEREGWDGDWYRRAYFDDGTPLGSAANAECRIDGIAQSWGVITGAAERARAVRAMAAVDEYLVRRGDGLVLLLTPPFDHTPLDPGYIKGYPPGVRENGGQYTHAAIWSVLAFAALGDGDKAGELFSILNPINHASTRAGAYRYKVEPYVVAADIYAEHPHVGRGGWTWYTGSAGWMYRAGIEWILGFRLRGPVLYLDPCIPRAWRGFQIRFRYHAALYEVSVENPHGVTRGVAVLELNGEPLDPKSGVPLGEEGTHHILVVLG